MANDASIKRCTAADKLGAVLAEIAILDKQADKLRDEIKSRGDGAYEGDLFRVTVKSSTEYRLDMKAVRAKLSPQFITANEHGTDKVTLKCVARSGRELQRSLEQAAQRVAA
jgi:hypothetical protein